MEFGSLISRLESATVYKTTFNRFDSAQKDYYYNPNQSFLTDEERAAHDLVRFFINLENEFSSEPEYPSFFSGRIPSNYRFTLDSLDRIKDKARKAAKYLKDNPYARPLEVMNFVANWAFLDYANIENFFNTGSTQFSERYLFQTKNSDHSIVEAFSRMNLEQLRNHESNFSRSGKVGFSEPLKLERIWWFHAVNEFCATSNLSINFGKWLEQNYPLIDSLYENFQVTAYTHTKSLIDRYTPVNNQGFGFIFRGTPSETKEKLYLLNSSQFNQMLRIGENRNSPISKTLYSEKISSVLEGETLPGISFLSMIKAMELQYFHNSEIPFPVKNEILKLQNLDLGIFDYEMSVVAKSLWDNRFQYSIEEFFGFMEGMRNPTIWIREDAGLYWILARKFIAAGQFLEFMKLISDFVHSQDLPTIAPSYQEWLKVVGQEDFLALSPGVLSSIVVNYKGEKKKLSNPKKESDFSSFKRRMQIIRNIV